jgi:predicted deacetylase
MPAEGSAPLGRVFVPEVHDLHPGMAPTLDQLLGLLPPNAAEVAALLVVPNWQGRHPLDGHAGFADRLRRMGGTLVLHGWTHSLGPSWADWLLYGHDNRSEFRRLGSGEAEARLRQGLGMLERCDLRADWFCAPRWQQGVATDEALRRLGMRGWMETAGLVLANGGRVRIPALNFDEGDRVWRNRVALRLRSGAIRRLLIAGQAFRFVLHPDDLKRPAVVRQIEAVATALREGGWRPVSMASLVEGRR